MNAQEVDEHERQRGERAEAGEPGIDDTQAGAADEIELDGYVACVELRATASKRATGPMLDEEIRSFASIIDRSHLASADSLGLVALLVDADRLDQLSQLDALVDARLCDALVSTTLVGLEHYARQPELQRPAEQRLAFRELGLAIGLDAAASMRSRKSPGTRASRRARCL